jgi:hypothetical protein
VLRGSIPKSGFRKDPPVAPGTLDHRTMPAAAAAAAAAAATNEAGRSNALGSSPTGPKLLPVLPSVAAAPLQPRVPQPLPQLVVPPPTAAAAFVTAPVPALATPVPDGATLVGTDPNGCPGYWRYERASGSKRLYPSRAVMGCVAFCVLLFFGLR